MDGTLIDSSAAMARIWGGWLTRHGLDAASIIPKIHGMRAADTIRQFNLKGVDPEAQSKVIEIEETEDTAGVFALPGAADFLAAIPKGKWALVTSAPIKLAHARLKAAGLPIPEIAVYGEDVKIGKPNPRPFTLGAELLGISNPACVAFEDSGAGVASAAAAGSQVVVITATHHAQMQTPHWAMRDYAGAKIAANGAGLKLSFV
nr:HAD-IA family hydrolase [Aestuariivirga litoralis]